MEVDHLDGRSFAIFFLLFNGDVNHMCPFRRPLNMEVSWEALRGYRSPMYPSREPLDVVGNLDNRYFNRYFHFHSWSPRGRCRPSMYLSGMDMVGHLDCRFYAKIAWAPQRQFLPPVHFSGKFLDFVIHLNRRYFVEVA